MGLEAGTSLAGGKMSPRAVVILQIGLENATKGREHALEKFSYPWGDIVALVRNDVPLWLFLGSAPRLNLSRLFVG